MRQRLRPPLACFLSPSSKIQYALIEGLADLRAHIVQLEQTNSFHHHPDNMALSTGIFTIQNVKYRNWAMLLNANEGEVVAGSSARANVGEKVRTLEM